MLGNQPTVRCCAIMPKEDASSYEYQPEEPVTKERFDEIVAGIVSMTEDVGKEHVDCVAGACPVDFGEKV